MISLVLISIVFRRIRDRQIQDRIREITGKMLKRRNGIPGNALEEKRQAEFELREVKKKKNNELFNSSFFSFFFS